MRKITINIVFIVLVVISVSVTVFAEVDNYGNEFIDPLDYAKIYSVDNGASVMYDLSLPSSWCQTGVFAGPEWSRKIGDYFGDPVSFWYTGETISMMFKPCTGSAGVGTQGQIKNAHFIDLTYFPRDSYFDGGIVVTVKGEDIEYNADCDIVYYFVDTQGVIVYSWYTHIYPEIFNVTSNQLNASYWHGFNLSELPIPENAVGILPVYTMKNVSINDDYEIIVEYLTPHFQFEMSALEMDALQNKKLQQTMKNVESALGDVESAIGDVESAIGDVESAIDEQNKQFDDFVNSTVPPNKSPIDGSINDLDKAESELTEQTNKGFNQIVNVITSSIAEITAYATAFVAISGILEMFFTLPILGPLVYISLGLGIFALITNLAMSVSRAETAKSKQSKNNAKGGKKG